MPIGIYLGMTNYGGGGSPGLGTVDFATLSADATSLRFPEANNLDSDAAARAYFNQPTGFNPPHWTGDGSYGFIVGCEKNALNGAVDFYLMRTTSLHVRVTGSERPGPLVLSVKDARAGHTPSSVTLTASIPTVRNFMIVVQRVTDVLYLTLYSCIDGSVISTTNSAMAGTAATSLGNFNVGSYGILTDSAPLTGINAAWPGDMEAVWFSSQTGNDTTWGQVAMGAPLSGVIGTSSAKMHKEFHGLYQPTSVAAVAGATGDTAGALTAPQSGGFFFGTTIRRQSPTVYLVPDRPEASKIYPWQVSDATVAVPVSGVASAGVLPEARMINKATGAVLTAWQSCGALTAGAFSSTIQVARMDEWGFLEFRDSANPTEALTHAFLTTDQAVGPVFVPVGQSQVQNHMFTDTALALPIAAGANRRYVVTKTSATGAIIGTTRSKFTERLCASTSFDGVVAMVNQLAALGVGPCQITMDAVGGTGALVGLNNGHPARPYNVSGITLAFKFVAGVVNTPKPVLLWNWLTNEAAEMVTYGADYFNAVLEGTGTAIATYPAVATQNYRDLYPNFDFVMSPGSRHQSVGTVGPSNTSDAGGVQYYNARNVGKSYAAANGYITGPEVNDCELTDSFHQLDTAVRGNILFGARMAAAAARYEGKYPASDTTIAAATLQPGGTQIVVTFNFAAGGSLYCAAPSAVTGFEVAGSRSGFTAVVSGNTVILTIASGTWTVGTAITHLYGYPDFYGTSVTQATLLDGFLYETYAADVVGLGLPVASYTGVVV